MRSAILFAILLVSASAQAQAADIASCRAIKAATARLNCYDSLPLAATPAARPDDADVIAIWSGSGSRTTEPFHVDGPWELQWGAVKGGLFSAELYHSDTGAMERLLANQTGSQPGTAYVAKGGDYYISFTAMADWSARAVRVTGPPSKNSAPAGAGGDDDALAGDTGTHDDLPPCNGLGASDDLKKVVENSPLGRTMHIRVLRVGAITTTTTKSGVMMCHADVVTNGGEQRYQFHLSRQGDDLYVLAKPE